MLQDHHDELAQQGPTARGAAGGSGSRSGSERPVLDGHDALDSLAALIQRIDLAPVSSRSAYLSAAYG